MAISIFPYFPIFSNENVPNTIQNFQRKFKILLNIKLPIKLLPKTFKILTLWRNFAKSGHTDDMASSPSTTTSKRATLTVSTYPHIHLSLFFKVGLNFALDPFSSCYSCKTVWLRPASCKPRWMGFKHRIFCQNLYPGIAGKFGRAFGRHTIDRMARWQKEKWRLTEIFLIKFLYVL